jgi:hypothetical protein
MLACSRLWLKCLLSSGVWHRAVRQIQAMASWCGVRRSVTSGSLALVVVTSQVVMLLFRWHMYTSQCIPQSVNSTGFSAFCCELSELRNTDSRYQCFGRNYSLWSLYTMIMLVFTVMSCWTLAQPRGSSLVGCRRPFMSAGRLLHPQTWGRAMQWW